MNLGNEPTCTLETSNAKSCNAIIVVNNMVLHRGVDITFSLDKYIPLEEKYRN